MFKMNAFHLVIMNLKQYKFFVLLIISNIMISSLIICFSYGLYQNYHIIINEGESTYTEIDIYPLNADKLSSSIDTRMLIDMVKGLSENTQKNIDSIHCDSIIETSAIEYNIFEFDFSYDNNRFHGTNINNIFDDDTYNSYEKVVAINPNLRYNAWEVPGIGLDGIGDWVCNPIGDTDSILVNGKDYCILENTYTDMVLMAPITAFYDDPVSLRRNRTSSCVTISFKSPMKNDQYDDIKNAISIYMQDNAYLPDINLSPVSEILYYKTVIVITMLISILASINYAIIYRYILHKRTKMIVVFRICGCSCIRAIAIYYLECVFVSFPLFALSEIIYAQVLLPLLGQVFDYIEYTYSFTLYVVIFLIYAILSSLVMLLSIIQFVYNKQIIELKR